jgi:isoleucyl-tRNA synthetase
MSNYKDTLNILKTDFEMRANLNVKEPKIEQKWLDDGIYQKLLQQNRDNKQ